MEQGLVAIYNEPEIRATLTRADGGLFSFEELSDLVPRALLQQFLSTLVDLRGADLLRVKGFVPTETGLVAVQGVRHVFDRLRPAERGEHALVFITNGVERGEVEALWQAMRRLA